MLVYLILHFILATLIAALVGTYLDQSWDNDKTFTDLMYPKFSIIRDSTNLTLIGKYLYYILFIVYKFATLPYYVVYRTFLRLHKVIFKEDS